MKLCLSHSESTNSSDSKFVLFSFIYTNLDVTFHADPNPLHMYEVEGKVTPGLNKLRATQ
jgi:hypothetical protein